MSVDLASIRAGLGANLRTVTGLRVYPYVTGQEQYPAAVVVPDDPWIDRDEAMGRGLVLTRWRVDVLVRTPSTERAQIDTETFVGTVVDGLLSDRTAGTTGADLKVETVSGFNVADGAGGEALSVSFSVTVSAPDQ